MEEKRSRHRLPISCVQCRRRKRKCDRQTPCHTCLHRGEADQCSYESPAEATQVMRIEDVRSDNHALRDRVHRLEELIHQYARNHTDHEVPFSARDGQSHQRKSFDGQSPGSLLGAGSLSSQDNRQEQSARYKSQTSWDHILRDLDELKVALSSSSIDSAFAFEDANDGDIDDSAAFLTSSGQTFSSLYAQLPSKPQMDALLSQYLNSYHPFSPIVSPMDFKRQYQTFISNPHDPAVLSLLFGMMGLAVVNNDPQDNMADIYIKCSLQALQVSHFITRFNLTTVVCLINIMSFLRRERGQQTFTWILFGCTLQIARSLGLHRDPLHFQITGQECQTRRHIWAALLSQDAIHAARYGRTTVIDMDEWDTKAPEQFGEEGTRISDPIPTAYAHAKRTIAMTIGRLFKSLFSPRTRPSYQTVLDVELDIRSSHGALMSCASEDLSSNRANLQAVQWLYSKYSPFLMAYTLIVIHRPFMVRRTSDFFQSRVTCLESARTLLRIVAEMENRPGMDHYAWHIREHRNIAYLPAATLLCIGLHIKQNASFEALPPEMGQSDDAADRRMIQDVIMRLPSGSDAHKIVLNLYNQVSQDHPADGFDPSMNDDASYRKFSESQYWPDNHQENQDHSGSWGNSTHFNHSSQPGSLFASVPEQGQHFNQNAMLSHFDFKWPPPSSDVHANRPYQSDQMMRNYDTGTAYWDNMQQN